MTASQGSGGRSLFYQEAARGAASMRCQSYVKPATKINQRYGFSKPFCHPMDRRVAIKAVRFRTTRAPHRY
jgi:hypothetical protein